MPVRSSNRCHHGRLSFSAAVSSRGECGQHSACRLEFGLYIAASAQAEVANSGESLGQHMQQESPNELHSFQGHLLALSRGGVVFEGEGDLAMVNSHDALVGNGDAMGISGLIRFSCFLRDPQIPHFEEEGRPLEPESCGGAIRSTDNPVGLAKGRDDVCPICIRQRSAA